MNGAAITIMETKYTYKKEKTREISFPLGGIGSGSIGLGGNGRLMEWEIFNRPNKGELNGFSHFAVKAEKNGSLIDARVLSGDLYKDLVGQYSQTQYSGYGYGPKIGTAAGFPHFSEHTFTGKFPIAQLDFSDKSFPGSVKMTAFNPFIPLDEDSSSIPAAFFEIEVNNTDDTPIEYTVALSVSNRFGGSVNTFEKRDSVSLIHLTQNILAPDNLDFGDIAIATDGAEISYQENWYRGSWFDGAGVYWRDFCGGNFKNRTYENAGGADTATIAVKIKADAGEAKCVRFVIAWNFPNRNNYWTSETDQNGKSKQDIIWKNHYATIFPDSASTAEYCLDKWDGLYSRTKAFCDALFDSTLPVEVIEAVSANLSVLKSPTVMRLEDGSFYGWEGVHERSGSCEGSCQHVWNYAYALPFLFPKLERSMRSLDFKYNQWENGRMSFRLQLPVGSKYNEFYPCVDGQMGAVIKTYREWKLCGDDRWLRGLWEDVKKAIEFAWNPENPHNWDSDKDGVLEGRQHHTLDMELYGPSSWLQSFYLAALKAGAEMAEYLGEGEKAREYLGLFELGKKWSEENLFNGEYFIHKIDLDDPRTLDKYGDQVAGYWNGEAGEIKYQIAGGCSIDQILGQWHANIIGLGEIFNPKMVHSALGSIYKYNYKKVMRDFFNPCRVFCLNGESGTVICDYPEGVRKPVVPVPYSEECMTGFEYQAAIHMISVGMTENGLELIRAIRDRYDGDKRNPWNEIECGSNYARSMASYACIPVFSGFTFDMPRGIIGFNPILENGEFRSIWSVDSGYGTVKITPERTDIILTEGSIRINTLKLPYVSDGKVTVTVDKNVLKLELRGGIIEMPNVNVNDRITVIC